MKKIIVIILLILSLLTSLFLFTDSRASPKVNINTSSVSELDALPGIGDVLAKRIIEGRPYNSIYELDKVKGIGPKTIEKITNKAVVK